MSVKRKLAMFYVVAFGSLLTIAIADIAQGDAIENSQAPIRITLVSIASMIVAILSIYVAFARKKSYKHGNDTEHGIYEELLDTKLVYAVIIAIIVVIIFGLLLSSLFLGVPFDLKKMVIG